MSAREAAVERVVDGQLGAGRDWIAWGHPVSQVGLGLDRECVGRLIDGPPGAKDALAVLRRVVMRRCVEEQEKVV